MNDLTVDVKRIETELYELANFGFNEEDRGIYRQGFSDADMAARRWLLGKMEGLGLATHMDGAGNVWGRYGSADRPAVVVGSHLDTVPAGGLFDGSLGVIAGLECVRILKESGLEPNHPIEVLGTSEEEGRFGGMLGAQAIAGQVTLDWVQTAANPAGERLAEAMDAQGLDHHEVTHAVRRPEEIEAFIELHIEQGPVLEAEHKTIGVVEGITGVFKWMVRLVGKPDHAGTAPMHMRSDAFMGLADFAHEIPRILDEEGTGLSRLTIGRVELKPGFPHTVPGEVNFTLVGRDLEPESMEALANACARVLGAISRKHRLRFEYEQLSWLEPSFCSPRLIDLVERKACERGYSNMRLPSGAGHDTQFFADITDAGLIFVPSVGGVSHAPDEWTNWNDVERGANVLLDCLVDLAVGDPPAISTASEASEPVIA